MNLLAILSRCAVLALLMLAACSVPPAHADPPLDERQALHLLDRLGYGPGPDAVARVRAMGAAAYVDGQLAPPPLPRYLEMRLGELADPGTPPGEEALLRAIASPRQLEEVLVDFWVGWFVKGQERGIDTADTARAALRPHVLGRYAQLAEQARSRGAAVADTDERAALRALAGHFVTTPSANLLRSLAQVWDATDGDQRAVLRALLTRREFLAPAQWKTRRKDDFRFVASAVRASGVWVENVAPLAEFLRRPMRPAGRAAFVERLAGGRLALKMAPPRPQGYASSAPPLRAGVAGGPPTGALAQPGPVLMEAPTPSAIAMAAAALSEPADPGGLRQLLNSEDFLRY